MSASVFPRMLRGVEVYALQGCLPIHNPFKLLATIFEVYAICEICGLVAQLMACRKLPDNKRFVYVQEFKRKKKKYPCADCFNCQWCRNERCRICRPGNCLKKKKSKNRYVVAELKVNKPISLYNKVQKIFCSSNILIFLTWTLLW